MTLEMVLIRCVPKYSRCVPVKAAVYQETQPSDGFCPDVESPCDAMPLEFPVPGLPPGCGP
jgi:hypothetical protein